MLGHSLEVHLVFNLRASMTGIPVREVVVLACLTYPASKGASLVLLGVRSSLSLIFFAHVAENIHPTGLLFGLFRGRTLCCGHKCLALSVHPRSSHGWDLFRDEAGLREGRLEFARSECRGVHSI